MSRGEKESICLERVKGVLFYNESKPVCNPFDCHSYLDVDDATFERDYDFRNEIKYVIFVNPQRVEVIRTENIPYLLQLMPWDYAIYSMQVCTIASVHNISIPNSLAKGDESDD